MKKIILLLIIITIIKTAQGQDMRIINVPKPVDKAFTQTHPAIKKVEWSKDGNNYIAEYQVEKMDYSVTYDSLGKLIETEEEIPVVALPVGAIEYISNNYKNNKVKKAFKITDSNGIVKYEARVKGVNLLFDSSCNLITSKN